MAFTILEHSEHGKVLFNYNTQEYYILPDSLKNELTSIDSIKEFKSQIQQLFTYNDKTYNFAYGFNEFLESDMKSAVIPVVCANHEWNKRRTILKITLIDSFNANLVFPHIERIGDEWVSNNVMVKKYSKDPKMHPGLCYFCVFTKNSEAQNDMTLMASIQIYKGMK